MKIKAFALLVLTFSPLSLFGSPGACPLSNGINVHSSTHVLNICKQGSIIKSFKVALGYSGVGKKHRGDNKTPIGLYSLSTPRKSSQFNVFIPILYPTPKQAAEGYTGKDVGIHGPTQSSGFFSWLSHLPAATRGCIAVGKNSNIEYVANWVKAHPGTKVLII